MLEQWAFQAPIHMCGEALAKGGAWFAATAASAIALLCTCPSRRKAIKLASDDSCLLQGLEVMLDLSWQLASMVIIAMTMIASGLAANICHVCDVCLESGIDVLPTTTNVGLGGCSTKRHHVLPRSHFRHFI
jgi:hypothetical protein